MISRGGAVKQSLTGPLRSAGRRVPAGRSPLPTAPTGRPVPGNATSDVVIPISLGEVRWQSKVNRRKQWLQWLARTASLTSVWYHSPVCALPCPAFSWPLALSPAGASVARRRWDHLAGEQSLACELQNACPPPGRFPGQSPSASSTQLSQGKAKVSRPHT